MPGFILRKQIAPNVWSAEEESRADGLSQYAVKVVPLKGAISRATFNREVEIWKQCVHQNIVCAQEIFEYSSKAVILMERTRNSLADILESHPHGLPYNYCATIFYQLCSALQFLSQQEVAYLNIAPRHILLQGRGRNSTVKLTDFSCALKGPFLPDAPMRTGLLGEEFYRAPEIESKKPYQPHLADIWSLGVLLHVMLTGLLPFPGFDRREALQNAALGKIELAASLPEGKEEFLRKILRPHPKDRCTLQFILDDPWVQSGKPVPKRRLAKSSESCHSSPTRDNLSPTSSSPSLLSRSSGGNRDEKKTGTFYLTRLLKKVSSSSVK